LAEFQNYRAPDDGRRFTEIYNVDKLTSAGRLGSSNVVISTIQRVFKALSNEDVDPRDDPGPTLSAYERGTKSPTLTVAERIVHSLSFDLGLQPQVTFREVPGEAAEPTWSLTSSGAWTRRTASPRSTAATPRASVGASTSLTAPAGSRAIPGSSGAAAKTRSSTTSTPPSSWTPGQT